MSEVRRVYRVAAVDANELNRVFGQLADRLDQLEGRRGTPEFKSALDLGGNRATNAGAAVEGTDLVQQEQVSPELARLSESLGTLSYGEIQALAAAIATIQGQIADLPGQAAADPNDTITSAGIAVNDAGTTLVTKKAEFDLLVTEVHDLKDKLRAAELIAP